MTLVNANRRAKAAGHDELPGKSHYFIGDDPAKWRTNIPTYARVRYAGVYRGIDLVYYGNQGQLEYDFVVAPGAAIDGAGSAYVTGWTRSTNFPTTAGAIQTVLAGATDAFVTKLDAAGSGLVYSTFLGGNVSDLSSVIAVDDAGSAYVSGSTTSTDFPTTAGAIQTTYLGFGDAFVTKLDATESALVYSTYLGGSSDDGGTGIAVDGAGSAYVTGYTLSPSFPTTTGAVQTSHAGDFDAFVAKIATLPTSIDECKNGGWNTFGVFKNQGDCVSFVVSKGRNPPSGP